MFFTYRNILTSQPLPHSVKYEAIIKKKKPEAYNSVLDQIKPYNYTRPCILNSVLLLLTGGVAAPLVNFLVAF